MKNLIYPVANLLLCATLIGCVADNPVGNDAEILAPDRVSVDASLDPEDIWICHHPGTKFHGELCVDEPYPDGCYERGSSTTYCWLLTPGECASDRDEPWKEYCKLLDDRL